MALDDNLQNAWFKLNDLELSARSREDERPLRDVDIRPWTDEDRAATHQIVQEMSGRLARMELRQSVLFQTSLSLVIKVNTFLYVAVGIFVIELVRRAYAFIVQ